MFLQIANTLGADAAQLTLNHANVDNTFTRHYARGTDGMDLVSVRTGEDTDITNRQKVHAPLVHS